MHLPHQSDPHARARRVLVVGIDGVRLDLLGELDTPRLDEIAAAGFLAPVLIDPGTPTMSGPCWATIATGVHVTKHAVWNNDFTGHRLAVFPDFLTRLTHGFGRRTYVAAAWEPLVLARAGGPLFNGPGRLSFVAPAAETCEDWEAVDERMVRDAVAVLREEDPEASFVYLGAVDETAHLRGCGADYRAAILRADERLGRLLDAVRARPTYADEDWTVIVVTDHGHVDEGGHGGDSLLERTAWIACAGPEFTPGSVTGPLRHVDVVPQIFASLGLTPDRHWTLDGLPFAASAARAAAEFQTV
ncbi:alkaline phosphatase family protein [Streptacidiphilus jiangxiensis]|uniref:Type I phosphodiesterase / nucleotide pyrophosphatase n=1 Tax=Streptacidiphilus jiangxiensis TaxID=235985 RepID=A0A1H7KSM7_STRJI|nr:Type I phosphodiesterase / nucleotide pyrophosphatase [Streptacidiphilus jiangxiensis]